MNRKLHPPGSGASACPTYLVVPSPLALAIPEVLSNPHLRQAVRPVLVIEGPSSESEPAQDSALKGFALLNRRTGALERLFVLDGRNHLLEWTLPTTPGRSIYDTPKLVSVTAGVRI